MRRTTCKNKLHRTGFTLIELIVAVGLMSLMMLLINQIFNDTFRAVSRGMQSGDIIAAHRAISDQLERDAEAMVPPAPIAGAPTKNESGFLIILNKKVTRGTDNVPMPKPNRGDGLDEVNTPLRSDQLIFMRFADALTGNTTESLEQTTPTNTGTSSPPSNTRSDFARVWYGHLDRTEVDGSKGTGTLANANFGQNEKGWRWLLGRQALILVGPTVNDNGGIPYVTGPNIYFGNSADIPGGLTTANQDTNRIEGVLYNTPIDSAMTTTGLVAGERVLYMGLTDVTNWAFNNDQDMGWDNDNDPSTSDIRFPSANVVIDLGGTNLVNSSLLQTGMTQAAYRTAIYPLTYGPERLRCNPFPEGVAIDGWQMAQMHPLLATNVSDFIVEFAADADNDGNIDTLVSGEIEWYGLNHLPTWSGSYTYDPSDTTPGLTNADTAFVWRHDYPDNWPYLIRIRYRMHDQRGDLMTSQYDTGANKYEPIAGKWFEVIIPVNRP